jgi:hypothetical protein
VIAEEDFVVQVKSMSRAKLEALAVDLLCKGGKGFVVFLSLVVNRGFVYSLILFMSCWYPCIAAVSHPQSFPLSHGE